MKVITLLLSVFLFITFSNAQKKPEEVQKSKRIEKVINSRWTFNYFPSETADKGYELPGFNDSKWPSISLPHTWNSYETTGVLQPFTRSPAETGDAYWWIGWGWYRKHFLISRDYSEYKVFVEFEGVQKYCKVWLNGKYLGDHKGGYGSFDFDITGYLKPGEDNVLAVAVNNLQKDEFKIHPVTSGSFNVSCGIYRNVTLVLKNKLFIPMQGSANHEGGTFISTPKVSEKEGIVKVQTWVKNDNTQSKSIILQTSIADQSNQIVQVIKSEAEINPGEINKFDQTSKPIINPHLWSNEDPYLYSVRTEVIDRKDVTDAYTSYFGFRWFRFDEKEACLLVNDKKIVIRGGNSHQQYPWLGDAIPKWITEMDYSDISQNMRYNFMHTANYPGDKLVYDLADKYGIIADEDFSAIADHGFSVEEEKQQLKEMIRRDRNHPGIMFWSVGDETRNADNIKFAISEDSTRRIKAIHLSADSALTYIEYGIIKSNAVAPSVAAGEPAKIILSGSHNKIGADKGSIVIIVADIIDSKGNHIPGASNSIKWKVSGPASLVGPPDYGSVIDRNSETDGVWYKGMPVTNLIRSTGKPGRVKVSVFSSGLASGSFEVDAEEIKTDNSVIAEPLPEEAGRKPVMRVTLSPERLNEIPKEIKMTSDEFKLGSSDKKESTRIMKDYILKNNSSIDTLSNEFRTLNDLFSSQLLNNDGRLSAEDYNFNVDHYNNCRLISGYITKTKLPPLFKESLKKYYADLLIRKGSEKNAGEEMNWLNWIPSGGVVVFVQNEKTNTSQKGAVFTKHTGLTEIIKVVYPQFAKFSEEAKERALIFISKMNPHISVTSVSEKSKTGDIELLTTVSYTAEKGGTILIPEYKFISE